MPRDEEQIGKVNSYQTVQPIFGVPQCQLSPRYLITHNNHAAHFCGKFTLQKPSTPPIKVVTFLGARINLFQRIFRKNCRWRDQYLIFISIFY